MTLLNSQFFAETARRWTLVFLIDRSTGTQLNVQNDYCTIKKNFINSTFRSDTLENFSYHSNVHKKYVDPGRIV